MSYSVLFTWMKLSRKAGLVWISDLASCYLVRLNILKRTLPFQSANTLPIR